MSPPYISPIRSTQNKRLLELPLMQASSAAVSKVPIEETIASMKAPCKRNKLMADNCNRSAATKVMLNENNGRSVRRVPAMPQPSALARQVASQVIKHARNIKYTNEHEMQCPDCHLFPMLPVTGACGHTRCTMCIKKSEICPCGTPAPESLHINILIQDLIEKILCGENSIPVTVLSLEEQLHMPSTSSGTGQNTSSASKRTLRQPIVPDPPVYVVTQVDDHFRQPVSAQARYIYARYLLSAGRYREAAPQFAHVAASSAPMAKSAKLLLSQVIAVLSEGKNPRRITRELYRAVREQSSTAWVKSSDMECVICFGVLQQPLTTPCGHTYCRPCIGRNLQYSRRCPLCSRRLNGFNVNRVADTTFVTAVLESIDAFTPSMSNESDFIPIFACTVAYPSIPCALLIFDSHFRVMIRQVLLSNSKQFGIVAYERNGVCSSFGTVVEVRDCVQFEDGRSIVSTMGLSRFRVVERGVKNGCRMARIETLTDKLPQPGLEVWNLNLLSQQVVYKATLWLESIDRKLLSDIQVAFGEIPIFFGTEEEWWMNPHGPHWLWWLIAILPLKPAIQVLMLSTQHLLKRMLAVSRTFDAMQWNEPGASSPRSSALTATDYSSESELYVIYENRRQRRLSQ